MGPPVSFAFLVLSQHVHVGRERDRFADNLRVDAVGQCCCSGISGTISRAEIDCLGQLFDFGIARVPFARLHADQFVLVQQFRHERSYG